MKEIRLVSLMAANSDFFYRELAGYLTRHTGIEIVSAGDPWWRERERMLDEGLAQIGFLCGLQYVQRIDGENRGIELLAAPVMESSRYRGEPIYFSELLVRHESALRRFDDLRGGSWGYNEPTSHSGYNLMRYYLALRGLTAGYFGRVFETGSHQNSLEMLLDGRVDSATIDSTVLELELRARPELGRAVRVIETLGPSPIPPAVIRRSVPHAVKQAVRNALLMMHENAEGRRILGGPSMARFVQTKDSDYEPIRSMARRAERVCLSNALVA